MYSIFWLTSARIANNIWVKTSGPKAMYEPYKSSYISCKNTFSAKENAAK